MARNSRTFLLIPSLFLLACGITIVDQEPCPDDAGVEQHDAEPIGECSEHSCAEPDKSCAPFGSTCLENTSANVYRCVPTMPQGCPHWEHIGKWVDGGFKPDMDAGEN